MTYFPTPDESRARLHQAGWSVGDTAFKTGKCHEIWLVTGTNGENVIESKGTTQAEAWWRAVEQEEALGMAGRRPKETGRESLSQRFSDL
jgi:hypothetical protein